MIGDRWGVTDDEMHRRYPCDDVVVTPVLQAWRGVTVRASPERVWPWLIQIRLAPYSYDWIDNLGRRSPQELRGLPDPVVGDRFTATAGRAVGTVASVTAGEELTGRIGWTYLSYVLVAEAGSTRLLLKIVTGRGRWIAPMLSVGDLVMSRRQLLNLQRLAGSAEQQPEAFRRRQER